GAALGAGLSGFPPLSKTMVRIVPTMTNAHQAMFGHREPVGDCWSVSTAASTVSRFGIRKITGGALDDSEDLRPDGRAMPPSTCGSAVDSEIPCARAVIMSPRSNE